MVIQRCDVRFGVSQRQMGEVVVAQVIYMLRIGQFLPVFISDLDDPE